MKLIKPSFEIIDQLPGVDGIYKQIELAGRTCYKSEDKITETSSKEFVNRMIKSGHGAMLEHGTVYLYIEYSSPAKDINYMKLSKIHRNYDSNKYSKVTYISPDNFIHKVYITTNLRVLVENNWLDDLKYLCEPTEFHKKRVTVRFICDRGVSHEFVRHRVFSFAQESTRYCNYSKDKFGGELTFIIPCWLDLKEGSYMWIDDWYINGINNHIHYGDKNFYLHNLNNCQTAYLWHIENNKWTPQQARAVLPNSLKTELVMTGFISDWEHFFELRDANSAHPQAKELAIPLREEFIKHGYIKNK